LWEQVTFQWDVDGVHCLEEQHALMDFYSDDTLKQIYNIYCTGSEPISLCTVCWEKNKQMPLLWGFCLFDPTDPEWGGIFHLRVWIWLFGVCSHFSDFASLSDY
jgi:hypothetical protein